MTKGRDPPFDFERDQPGTNARTEAEADIEMLRRRGGLFVEAVARTRMPMAVADTLQSGNPIVFANDAFLRLSGYSIEEVLGRDPHFLNGPDTDPRDAAQFREALRRGDDIVVESFQYRKDGSRFFAAVFCSPVADEDGQVIQHFLSYLDITRRVEAEQQLRDRASKLEAIIADRVRELTESEQRFRRIVESATDYAIFTTDPGGIITDWLPGAEAVFGWRAEEAIGQPLAMTFVPEDRAAGDHEKEMAIAAREGVAPNVRWHLRKDGRRVFIEGSVVPLTSEDGRLRGYLKIGQDVTDRKATEQRQKLLLAELQHRVRNTLGVVRSIARRTAQNSRNVEEMSAHLEGRLDAFARVQAIVTRRPEAGIDLAAMIEDELVAHAAREGTGLTLDGPDVTLAARPAETLSLAIHELATNAVKYGALSADGGHLEIRWRLAGGRLELDWTESRVEGVAAEPVSEGFGLELLRRVVPYELAADTAVDFRPDGLRFTLSMPIEGNIRAS